MKRTLRAAQVTLARMLFNARLNAFDRKVFEAGFNRAGRTVYHVAILEVSVGDTALQQELDEIYAKYDAVVLKK